MQSIWHLQTYLIEVSNGEVIHSATCIPAPLEGRTCKINAYDPNDYTIDGLFETVKWVLQSNHAKWARIEYDPDYGFPSLITFDNPNILDEDNQWIVEEFTEFDQ